VTRSIGTIKQYLEAAVTSLKRQPSGARGPLRGKDFMLDDQTFGADRDGQ
jgi:hypothetical protein